MTDFRPLKTIGAALCLWAKRGEQYVYTSVEHSGRIRHAANQVGIALSWMSRGYQYDDRSFLERMTAGNYYWRAAFRTLFAR